MLPKPKHTPLSKEGWERKPFLKKLDIWVSSFLPGWLIEFAVALFFALCITAAIMSVFALASWDLSWFWSVTSRAAFGVLTVLFSFILWAQS